ncbi:nuclear transport factor 2 family protein [Nocardioides sp. 616]|uniref:nuclear transport factor 2 family protein n=1 Tax=Nocardioides sp. 616 TaxID=2268090 RepID=UPI000CE45A00|nr:nuclear transport factor 2 family protein [Nocardioides sp. 616]
MSEELLERVRRLEDRNAIEELLARYGNACDDRDMEALAGCFARDFEFDSVAGHSVGRDAAMAYYGERLGSYGVTLHIPHTLVLEELEEDTARGVVLSSAEMEIEHEMFVTGFRYHDRYVRDEGRWRFRSRQVQAFYAMPLRELAGRLDPLRVRWPGTEPKAAPLPELLPSWQEFRGPRE